MTFNRPQTGRYVNPYTDFGFKWLFETEVNKELLIEFLNALLHLESPIKDIAYKNGEQLGDTISNRRAVFDVYCKSESGEHFIVEMQREIQKFFIDRSVYYSTFPIREQAIRGEEWNFQLSAVYTVGILDFVFDESDEYRHEAKIIDTVTEKVLYDKLTFVYLEMPKFKKDIKECDTLLDKWMYVLKNMTRLLDRPVELQQRVFEKLFKTAEVANFSEKQRLEYEESLKEYRDFNNVMETKEQIGFEKGVDKGLRQTAGNLKKMGMSTEQIAQATGLSPNVIESL